ncbi:MAG: DUF479 domain-containing protein [Chlorobi bacterium]|nr:DUF479 domain-containing protein [Chlorobiota bacterium]
MNFLAHAHLSGKNDEILFGNFVADAVKGNELMNYEGDIRLGIRIHRKIDVFTDRHEIFRQSVARIRSSFGKYSGIVVDIYYDHFLARNWNDFHRDPLPLFAGHVYDILLDRYGLLPKKTKRLLPFLVTQNWLVGYADFNGLKRVFYGMDRRTGFGSGMKTAVDELKENYDALYSDFGSFYPGLQEYVLDEIAAFQSDESQI